MKKGIILQCSLEVYYLFKTLISERTQPFEIFETLENLILLCSEVEAEGVGEKLF